MIQRLDISVGPVQGFVAQSRRTRDLWGSSYLLAFLTAHAMQGVTKAGGRITRPVVDEDPLYRYVCGRRDGEPPRLGSLPNRFEVRVEDNASEVASKGVAALDAAWKRVCDAVWEKYVEGLRSLGQGTEHIWHRQIGSFWEVTWTAVATDSRDNALARRKHWRNHCPPEEPGDKCTVMHDLQEISGYVRSLEGRERQGQEEFWNGLRGRLGKLDLRDNERLCAIALIKRLFPKVSDRALGWKMEQSRWPSTIHIGARPWMRRVETSAPEQARDYAEAVRQNASGDVFSESRFCIQSVSGKFQMLGPHWFFRENLKKESLCSSLSDEARGVMDKRLKDIYAIKGLDGRPVGKPAVFYAMLIADGDRLGRLVSDLGGDHVSKALARFTDGVPSIVREHDGETVYAGGDDVLAMLPVPKALSCAAALADCYRSAFEQHEKATISAAVAFSHVRLSLRVTIEHAHRLLDQVAKDGNGRNSLAVAVLKSGGLNCQWVTSWARKDDQGAWRCAVKCLGDLVKHIGTSPGEPGLSSSLIYRVRELLGSLSQRGAWRPGEGGEFSSGHLVPALLRAEIGHSLSSEPSEVPESRVKELANLVWNMLIPSHASDEPGGEGTAVFMDALLLARFLSDPRQWEDDQ